MRRAFLSVLGVLALAGCTKEQAAAPLCDVAIKSLTGAAQGVASALGCSDLPSVAAALTKPVTDLKICGGTTTQGMIADLVCPQVAKSVMGIGLSTLPADWKCTGGTLGDQAAKVLEDGCRKYVSF